MLSYADYLQLLPKTELHCHFTSTMTAELFVALAGKHGVELPTKDPARLFAYADLREFLVGFELAHDVLRDPEDIEAVALEGVRVGVEAGLRYREYYVNPQYFMARGMSYADVVDPSSRGSRPRRHSTGSDFVSSSRSIVQRAVPKPSVSSNSWPRTRDRVSSDSGWMI